MHSRRIPSCYKYNYLIWTMSLIYYNKLSTHEDENMKWPEAFRDVGVIWAIAFIIWTIGKHIL